MKRDDDIGAEIRAHLEMAEQDRMDRGENAESAAAGARRELGNPLLIEEEVRSVWGRLWMERLVQDLRYAWRQLRANPGFAIVAVLSLALGIGANTAIFSILNALLLRGLPVAAPDELHLLTPESTNSNAPQRYSYPAFAHLRNSLSGKSSVAAMGYMMRAAASIDGDAAPETALAQLVSVEFFPLLGIRTAAGRFLGADEPKSQEAVLSYEYWQRRFQGSKDVLGKTIRVNRTPVTVVGVAEQGFRGLWVEMPTDIWIPLSLQPDVHYSQNFSSHNSANPEQPWISQKFVDWLQVVVRCDPRNAGSTKDALNAAYGAYTADLTGAMGPNRQKFFKERLLTMEPIPRGMSNLRGRFVSPLLALMGLVALVLVVACVNTANLLLARAEGRKREMAVRLSIGASRSRVIRQLLTESLLLAAIAAGLGTLLAGWAGRELVRLALSIPAGSPLMMDVRIDGRVVLFTICLTVATALLFGLVPAMRASQAGLGEAMKTSTGTARRRWAPARYLVAAQVALSLLVVAGAGLFARSLYNLNQIQLGFDTQHVITVMVNTRAGGYDGSQTVPLYNRLIERLETVPGVASAASSMCGLVMGCTSTSDGFRVPAYQAQPDEKIRVQFSYVGPKYFTTVGAHLLAGREFEERPGDRNGRVIIVNQSLVRRYFAGKNPVGQMMFQSVGSSEQAAEIIGVIDDARVNSVREAASPMIYFPIAGAMIFGGVIEVRAAAEKPETVIAAIRSAIHEVEPNLPIERITTVSEYVNRNLSQDRLIAVLAGWFGALALGLACFGLYGVMSYGVTRRIPEIGVRLALGAHPPAILWQVLRDALLLVAVGLAIGVPFTMLAMRSMGSLLYEVKANDGLVLFTAAGAMVLVTLAAAAVPAWRAARIDPVVALRNE